LVRIFYFIKFLLILITYFTYIIENAFLYAITILFMKAITIKIYLLRKALKKL